MILVIDYGMGNLRSVSKALEHLGAKVKVSARPEEIQKADKLVLPGVGAFGDAIKELRARELFEPLKHSIASKIPFLGVCLGLQLLFEASEESPNIKGLGVFKGKVQRFQTPEIKIPHMGWNTLEIKKRHPLLKGVKNQSYFYFVHSYYAVPSKSQIAIGKVRYGRENFAAVVSCDNVFATQFHPEKSQADGLKILKNFIEW